MSGKRIVSFVALEAFLNDAVVVVPAGTQVARTVERDDDGSFLGFKPVILEHDEAVEFSIDPGTVLALAVSALRNKSGKATSGGLNTKRRWKVGSR